MPTKTKKPRCVVIAGPNGAGKTTFAREFLPKDERIINFVNADLIAGGLSPLRPELAAFAAGRLFLAELDRLARSKVDFAFETTLSGQTYLTRLNQWKSSGYRIEIAYLRLASPRIALKRIAERVKQGGHNVPTKDVLRRFARGWDNFCGVYRPLADTWAVYDNSGEIPVTGKVQMKPKRVAPKQKDFATRVGQALRRSAKAARQEAKIHGTLLYFLKDGKIVAEKP